MAIHENDSIESQQGFRKEIDAGGLEMVMNNLQINQYQFPIPSTIRELASNAVDAVREKQIAIEILSGRAKEEDYYLRREEAVFQSSNFNAGYFDLNHLDIGNHMVQIIYKEGDQINTKDKLIIKDPGVGLGGERLEGYFKLSWSSKRNSRDALGKFGIGAKSPLSTNVESYRMTSVYNGMKFVFDIYSHKVDSVVPRFNHEGQPNDCYIFQNGYKAYYEKTTEKNGTMIEVEGKKHNRQKYIDAVKSQLLYFKNIEFIVVRESGIEDKINFKAGILYEDDDIILSDTNQFSKPHLVIGRAESRVNYGYIDFLELELENKNGNIGIKVASEEVSINPSRESVIWNDATRKTVTDKFEKVVEISTNLIQKELLEKDFVSWMNKCANVLSGSGVYGSSSVLARLAQVVDKTALSPSWSQDSRVKYKPVSIMMPGVQFRVCTLGREYNKATGKNEEKVLRDDKGFWSDTLGKQIYIARGSASKAKDMYLLKTFGPFVVIKEKELDFMDKVKLKKEAKGFKDLDDQTEYYMDLFKESVHVKDYDSLVIPEDWNKKFEEAEKAEELIPQVVLTPAEKRALEERIVLYTLYKDDARSDGKLFTWEKREPKLKEALDWEGTVVYGTQEDEPLIHFLGAIMYDLQPTNTLDSYQVRFYQEDFKIVRINQSLVNKFKKKHTHIKEFFARLEETTITMDNMMVKWHTARRIDEELAKLPFFNNYATFNYDMTMKVEGLKQYRDKHFISIETNMRRNKFGCTPEAYAELCQNANRIIEFQKFVAEHEDDAQAIAEKATAIFNSPGITNGQAVELDIYNQLLEVIEYAEPLKVLFNHIDVLTTPYAKIGYDLETEIKSIIQYKDSQ